MASFLEKVNAARGGGPTVPTVGKDDTVDRIKRIVENRSGAGDTFQNKVMQAITFGGMDNLTSAIDAGIKAPFSDRTFGEVYRENQDIERQVRERQDEAHPGVGGAGTVLGSLMSPDPTGKLKVLGKAGQVGKSLISGTVAGGLQAFGESDQQAWADKLKATADGMMWGGALGTVAGAAGKGATSVLTRRANSKLQRGLDEMTNATKQGYKAAYETGEAIPGQVVSNQLNAAATGIRSSPGYRAALHPKVEALLEDMDKLVTTPTPNGQVAIQDVHLAQLDEMQKKLWKEYHANPKEAHHIIPIIKSLDQAMDEGAAQGSDLLKAARAASRMERNTEMFDKIMKKAERQAGSGSGDYASRFKYAAEKILDSEKYSQFLDNEEKAALQAIIDGTTTGNVARYIGRFAPSGGNLASLINTITFYNNPVLGIPAMVGAVTAKGVSNKSTQNMVEEARRVLSGSPSAGPQMQPGPTMGKAAAQAVAPDMPSLLDMSGLTTPSQAANPTLMQIQDIRMRQMQQQAGQ